MTVPQWVALDQRKNRLDRRRAPIDEINKALRAPWIEHQMARTRNSQSATPVPEAVLGHLLDGLLERGETSDTWGWADLRRLRQALAPGPEPTLRQSSAPLLTESHRPAPPQSVAKTLERFFDWLTTPSFAELHPIVQMSLTQARLLEIHPFPDSAEALATAFASHFPIKGGYLLPIPSPADAGRFSDVLEAAFQLSTDPIVQFNLQAALNAYDAADRLLGV